MSPGKVYSSHVFYRIKYLYDDYQIIIEVAQQEWRLARQHKQRLNDLRTQLGGYGIHTISITSSANEAKTQDLLELMRERTITSHVKQLRIHEATVGKRRRANP